MDFKPKNREWVKNAAIVFLAVLLVLTFFSNTWMNRSLPEVATQSVTDGAITAKVRGTGTVSANGAHQVKASSTRVIRAVMVKAGQEVNAGDVLFVLGEGESDEIEAAQEALRALQISYQRAAVGAPGSSSYRADELRIESANEEMARAYAKMIALEKAAAKDKDLPTQQRDEAQKEADDKQAELDAANEELVAATQALTTATNTLNEYKGTYDSMLNAAVVDLSQKEAALKVAEEKYNEAQAAYEADSSAANEEARDKAKKEYEEAKEAKESAEIYKNSLPNTEIGSQVNAQTAAVQAAQATVDAAQAKVDQLKDELDKAKEKVEAFQKIIDEILEAAADSSAYIAAREAYYAALINYEELVAALQAKKQADAKAAAAAGIDLTDIGQQIQRAKEKLEQLSGGEGNQITAKVSGTVQSVSCTSGDTKVKDDVLCTIEVPDMGYTLSFSVTNEQARRLRPGDSASVSNYYWGNQIQASLNNIQVDPKNPQTNKLLTFDLDGDVSAGAELTVSVGSKSANYDTVVPNSAIRSDANGSFVLAVEAKNSPLGNRYIARRVNVEVLASDDVNSAVTADLGWGDYVITTSNAPVKNGDMVRLADA